MIIVDSSVLIPLLRGQDTPEVQFLATLEEHGLTYGIPAICAQEILQGASDIKEYKLLEKYLYAQDLITTDDQIKWHMTAAAIYFECRRIGETVRSIVDCLIAQLALEHDAILVQADKDYQKVAKVRPLKLSLPLGPAQK